MNYRLGIDVGGTNTDAVIIDEKNVIIAEYKTPTTADISLGVELAVNKILETADIDRSLVKHVMLGTTHATNAIIERKNLSPVGVIRIAGPSGYAIPPFTAWPEDLAEKVSAGYSIVQGGYEYNGTPLAALNHDEIKNSLDQLVKNGARAIAFSCAFSPVNHDAECIAADIVRQTLGHDFPVTLSHEIGSIGLLERENAAILNAAIRSLAEKAYGSLQQSIQKNGIAAELNITQNDGTLMALDYAKRYPVLTIASGPTNSLRGAAFLSKKTDALVADVGGTTTDIGILRNGFPRESGAAITICGVRTNFRMPDLVSIGLGGGSIVYINEKPLRVGPQSVGFRISTEALVFGGTVPTATDIAVKNGLTEVGNRSALTGISSLQAEEAASVIKNLIENAIDTMKTSSGDIPVILVGGGSIIVPKDLKGASDVIIPKHFGVANAIGAAIAQVSGNIDGIFDVTVKGREKILEEIKEQAINETAKAGAAKNSIKIVEVEEIPLAYLPSNAVRFRVKAVGDLAVY